MSQKYKYRAAIFFTIILMALISAPSIILSIDNSCDVTSFYSMAEEEENNNVKLLFDNPFEDSEDIFDGLKKRNVIGYAFKNYPKPHLNLISPPPELQA